MSRDWASVNGPQKEWSSGNSSAEASIAVDRIASTRLLIDACHARRWVGSSPASRSTTATSATRSPCSSRKMVGAVIAPSADPGSTAMPGSSVHRPLGAPDGMAGSEDAGAWSASSQSAAACRALRHASSAVSAAIRAASASTVSRSSDPARLRADSCSLRGG